MNRKGRNCCNKCEDEDDEQRGVRPRIHVSTRQRIMWRRGKGGRCGVFRYIRRRWTWHTRRELLQQIEKQQIKRGEIKVVKMKMMKINKKVMKWNAKTMNTNANASICSHNENTSYKGWNINIKNMNLMTITHMYLKRDYQTWRWRTCWKSRASSQCEKEVELAREEKKTEMLSMCQLWTVCLKGLYCLKLRVWDIWWGFCFRQQDPPLLWGAISWASLNQIEQSKEHQKRPEQLYNPSSNPEGSWPWLRSQISSMLCSIRVPSCCKVYDDSRVDSSF